MNDVDFFVNSCFPTGPLPTEDPNNIPNGSYLQEAFKRITDTISKKAKTQPREDALNNRHPSNQGGMVVSELGNVEIRAGHDLYDHSIGASIILSKSSYVTLTAPAGLVFSGKSINLTGKPSEMFKFVGGQFQLNPIWEETSLVCSPKESTINSGDIQLLYLTMITPSGEMVPVRFMDYFDTNPLYISTGTS